MSPELPEALEVALEVADTLDRLGVEYHLGGSYASSIHGLPRQTQDIDVVVELGWVDPDAFARAFGATCYVDAGSVRRARSSRSSFNMVHLGTGIKVDCFVRGDAPFDLSEFRRHRSEVIRAEPERRVNVKSPEDILLRKLQWYRMGGGTSDRQWGDVLGIVRTQGDRLDRSYLQAWAQELEVAPLLERALREE